MERGARIQGIESNGNVVVDYLGWSLFHWSAWHRWCRIGRSERILQEATFDISTSSQNSISRAEPRWMPSGPRWNTARLDKDIFTWMLWAGRPSLIPIYRERATGNDAYNLYDATIKLIHRACDASMPRQRERPQRQWKSPHHQSYALEIALAAKSWVSSTRSVLRGAAVI